MPCIEHHETLPKMGKEIPLKTGNHFIRSLRIHEGGPELPGCIGTQPKGLRWKKHTPWHASDVPFAFETFEVMLDALRGLAQGDRSLESSKETNRLLQEPGYRPPRKEVKSLIRGMQEYSEYLVDAQTSLIFGKAYLDVSDESSRRGLHSGRRPIPEDVLRRVAARYERVADANLEYVDALLSRPLAARLICSFSNARMVSIT